MSLSSSLPAEGKCLLLLRISACLTLLSRGWLYLRWGSPLRECLWSEAWMAPWVQRALKLDWERYAANSDPYISLSIRLLGVILIGGGVAAILYQKQRRRCGDLLAFSGLLLLIHAFASWFEKDFQLGMLLELSLQSICPFALWWLVSDSPGQSKLPLLLKLATATTFVGHGLYAIQHHPLPADFVTMCLRLLPLNEASARHFLQLAGYLDFLAALALFIPHRRLQAAALIYMSTWGFLTAAARLISHFSPDLRFYGLDPWLFEMLVRSSHGCIPLLLLLTLKQPVKSQASS